MKLFFRWYDIWIGAYIDRPRRVLYICPIPMVGVRIKLPERHYLIWGRYYKEKPIGCTSSRGREGVREEEPGSTFQRISKRKCPICKGVPE